jgi:hypothetical protein
MVKLREILQERFQKKEKPKMNELGSKTSKGELTPFAGVFGTPKAAEEERQELTALLVKYASEEQTDISQDLSSLLLLTVEVKAINNQAALLHGERIKKAQEILKKYREGAFTAWLKCSYGNRQTPYNLLQYYEFYLSMPKLLHSQIEAMPRQAIYTLASREGDLSKKEEIVRSYKGETKQQMIALIRNLFPLKEHDKRKEKFIENTIKQLDRLQTEWPEKALRLTSGEKRQLLTLLNSLKKSVEDSQVL